MKVSSKARYGIKALLDLALNGKYDLVALKSIADRQAISDRYLEQVFSLLKKSGFVKSVKGPQGGYSLACDPSKVTAYDLVMALEGQEVFQVSYNKNDLAEGVINKFLWQPLDQTVEASLKSITLASLISEYEQALNPNSHMYFI